MTHTELESAQVREIPYGPGLIANEVPTVQQLVESTFIGRNDRGNIIVFLLYRINKDSEPSIITPEMKTISPVKALSEIYQSFSMFDPGKNDATTKAVYKELVNQNRLANVTIKQYKPFEKWWVKTDAHGISYVNYYQKNTLAYDMRNDYRECATKKQILWFDEWLFGMFSGKPETSRVCTGVVAHFLNNPFIPTGIGMMLYSEAGATGKSTLMQIMQQVIGSQMAWPEDTIEPSPFTASNTVPALTTVDEVSSFGGKKHFSKLKTNMTKPTRMCMVKYGDKQAAQNYGLFIGACNEHLTIPDQNRRFLLCQVINEEIETERFIAKGKELGIILDDKSNEETIVLTEDGIKFIVGWAQLKHDDPHYKISDMGALSKAKQGSDLALWSQWVEGISKDAETVKKEQTKILTRILTEKPAAFYEGLKKTMSPHKTTLYPHTFVHDIPIDFSGINYKNLVIALNDLLHSEFFESMDIKISRGSNRRYAYAIGSYSSMHKQFKECIDAFLESVKEEKK